ncbi:MAG: CHASE2 domain-containing protein, partial [Gammaproteobacteria bacterium]|nr:CHASE2 domain-containing protein [Gammaproteobacteria bacterium]
MKKAFWTTDWFTGLAISLVFLIAWLAALPILQGMERNAYDLGVRLASRTPDATQAEVAVIAIDDQSIENIGRWPWSREVHADMVDRLSGAGAKVIGLNIFYSEEQVDPGLTYIRRVREQLDQGDFAAVDLSTVNLTLEEAETSLDTDALLAESLESSTRVILPMQFVPGEVLGNPDEDLPDYVTRFALPEDNIIDPEGLAGVTTFDTVKANSPVPRIGGAAAGIGHLVNPIDLDGGLRREILMVRY